ncbi:MAG: hypothetical protein KBG73_17610, partial [Candidatus Promineofilum sp.]|nr:hypothetical protein [Promineifilum sp.]
PGRGLGRGSSGSAKQAPSQRARALVPSPPGRGLGRGSSDPTKQDPLPNPLPKGEGAYTGGD